ncbi:MAG: hypothetical protein JSU65_02165, partial [Candidatus Zixiibacteriota bacterium]
MRLHRVKRKDHGSSSGSTPADGNDTRPEVEIEPDVIAADGRPFYPLDGAASQALVIHCGDPRFQTAFRRFITEELGLANYTPVVVGGGIHAFGVQSFLPKNFKILWEQIKFFIKEGGIRNVVIINHDDCAWYKKMKGYHPLVRLATRGKLDLVVAARTILRDFACVTVRSYWASLEGDSI